MQRAGWADECGDAASAAASLSVSKLGNCAGADAAERIKLRIQASELTTALATSTLAQLLRSAEKWSGVCRQDNFLDCETCTQR